ncbi:MAG: hypothetical protein FJZ63_04435 [Chlamydiae bacterium]|nr:hypothetical protein [Chlamydiota bacterium]
MMCRMQLPGSPYQERFSSLSDLKNTVNKLTELLLTNYWALVFLRQDCIEGGEKSLKDYFHSFMPVLVSQGLLDQEGQVPEFVKRIVRLYVVGSEMDLRVIQVGS